MDWPRPGAVLHTTGLWGRSYLGVGRRASSRAWQNTLSKGRHGLIVRETLPWKNTHMGLSERNQAILTPRPVQGLAGDPGVLTPVLGLASDCATQSDCRGCWRNSTRVRHPGNWTGGGKMRSHSRVRGNGKRDTGQLFPPITCYTTHGKRLAQGRDCKIWWMCSVSPNTCGVSPHPRGARFALRLVSQGDGIHYPVGQSLLGDSLPFLLISMANKKLLRASEALSAVHIYVQCSYGTQ